MTCEIRAQQNYLEKFNNKQTRVQLNELIAKRKKYLKFLRRDDYKRFEWLLERLDIKYVPEPSDYQPVPRKESMRRLTERYCNNIKNSKLEALKKDLQSQQLDFLASKIEKLKFIRKEQIDCKIPVTISEEKINAVQNQYEALKQVREEEAEILRQNEVRDDYEIKL